MSTESFSFCYHVGVNFPQPCTSINCQRMLLAVENAPLDILNRTLTLFVSNSGRLYWHNLLNQADCKSLFPVFLMYTSGMLNGFGWVLPKKVNNTRFVHPTNASFPVRCVNYLRYESSEYITLTSNRCGLGPLQTG